MADAPETGWLIHKAGRGWYRPNAQGYTAHPHEAGRYSYKDALSYSHPNGWDGPRDEITIKHESEIPPAPDLIPRADADLAVAERKLAEDRLVALIRRAHDVIIRDEKDGAVWAQLLADMAREIDNG